MTKIYFANCLVLSNKGITFVLVMIYSITYRTKKGGSGVMTTKDFSEVVRKVKSCFKQKLPATVYKDGEKIGNVWEDNSCRTGWNYLINLTSLSGE